MDTKSKKSKSVKSFRAKAVAFVLCVLLGAGGLMALALGLDYVLNKLDESRGNIGFAGSGFAYAGKTYIDDESIVTDMFSGKPYIDSNSFASRAESNLYAAMNIFLNGDDGVASLEIKSQADSDYESSLEQIYNILVERLKSSGYLGAAVTGHAIDESALVYKWTGQTVTDVEGGVNMSLAPIEFDARKFLDETKVFEVVPDIVSTDIAEAEISEGGTEYSIEGGNPTDWYPNEYVDSYENETISVVRGEFERVYAAEISLMRSELEQYHAETRKQRYSAALDELAKGDMLYCISDGKRTIANVALNDMSLPADTSVFTSSAAWLSYLPNSGEGPSVSPLSSKPEILKKGLVEYGLSESELDTITVYIAWQKEVMAKGDNALSAARQTAMYVVLPAIIAGATSIVLFILSIVWTGRRRGDEDSYTCDRAAGASGLCAWDSVFIEIQIVLAVLVCAISFYVISQLSVMAHLRSFNIGLIPILAVFVVACTSVLWCLLSVVRIGKARVFARRLIVWIALKCVWRGVRGLARAIKSGFDGRNPLAKTIILVGLFWFVVIVLCGVIGQGSFFGVIMLFAVLVAALYFSVKWAKRYGELKRGVEEIAGGNLKYKIPVRPNASSEFERLSMKINEIGEAADIAIQGELKNQRLKTDLISNVSHDLKTPLTSIITYTDLLKKEGLDSDRAAEYLKVIDEKSRRLKKLTEDLFEAAKASSGAIPVRMEKVDLLSLVNQELAELGDGLAGIDLEVFVGARSEHCYVNADSQLIWRVVDNLLNNVRKYAMPGSRVYIDLKEYKAEGRRPTMSLEIKNTSAAKLNIPADELLERFQRGDSSRATEGSGLGLSIARDLVRLMDGRFDIAIDGDLFKATVTLAGWEGDMS
ncbi:MAG: HAMP domain-containing histidine kinase [Clostridiales Family XIII bacterium]|nr:HAMP domain-containing histidine kinase [Clostridiales Family XIII bacterium]